jgi:hypothetical protein
MSTMQGRAPRLGSLADHQATTQIGIRRPVPAPAVLATG